MRVYWEDTDAGGIVYYANYLRYFERARSDWLRELGFSQQRLREASGEMFVVSDVSVKYLQPARLDDEIVITVVPQEVRGASMRIAQQAWRGDTLLAEGEVRIGWIDRASLRPRRIPAAIVEAASLR